MCHILSPSVSVSKSVDRFLYRRGRGGKGFISPVWSA